MSHSVPPPNGANQSSQQPSLRTLRGTQPGLLDPTQPSRILRYSDSKLSFASFDPKTALVEDPSIQKLHISENLTPPKRIVIETTSKGASFWRFVPRARLEEGTQDEGVWPRVIDICGEKVQCFQEQWEIYKLDPAYRCVVYPWPKYSAIMKVDLANQTFEATEPGTSKRTQRPSPEVTDSSPQKRARSRHVEQEGDLGSTTDEDEDEIEEMMVDDSVPQKPKAGRRPLRTSREKLQKERYQRWARNKKAQEKRFQAPPPPPASDGSFSMRVDTEDTFPSQHTHSQPEDSTKRKDNQATELEGDDEAERNFGSRFSKRPRTLSPQAAREGVRKTHTKYEKKKWERLRQYEQFNREAAREAARRRLYEPRIFPVPPVVEVDDEDEDEDEDEDDEEDEADDETEDDEPELDTPEANSQPQANPDETPSYPESSREAEIAESIRKLRELERDRPLWEEQRKKREAHEHAEEEERRRKAESARRLEEEQRFIRAHLAEQVRRMEELEAQRRVMEEEQRRQRTNHQRRQKERWESGIWTTHRALERYRMLSDEFDAAKFSPEEPVTFHDIPWPVLHPPSRLTIEDIDWSAVESFFATVKSHMRLQDYKDFVEKSHRRFHPDRWRARKLWPAVTDEVERGYLEVAANTVAQALTPIWRAAREK